MQGFFQIFFAARKTEICKAFSSLRCARTRLRYPRRKILPSRCRSTFRPGVAQALTARRMWVGLQSPFRLQEQAGDPRSDPSLLGMFSETIELRGHIIDSLILPKVLDQVLTHGGNFKIGEIRSEPDASRASPLEGSNLLTCARTRPQRGMTGRASDMGDTRRPFTKVSG